MRLDSEREIEELRRNVRNLADKLVACEANLDYALGQIEKESELKKMWIDMYNKSYKKEVVLGEKLQEAENELIRLKARLYDVLEGDAR